MQSVPSIITSSFVYRVRVARPVPLCKDFQYTIDLLRFCLKVKLTAKFSAQNFPSRKQWTMKVKLDFFAYLNALSKRMRPNSKYSM